MTAWAGLSHAEVCETDDPVIFAVGQRPELPEGFGLITSSRGLVETDGTGVATERDGVFVAGDAVSGSSSVIEAIASGRKAAAAIDRYLGGSGRIDKRLAPQTEPTPFLGPGDGFAALARPPEVCLAAQERLGGFCEVVAGMDENAATYESERCLQCDLRLKIKTVEFWGSF